MYEKTSLGPTTKIYHELLPHPKKVFSAHLWGQTLEEGIDTLGLDHFSDNGHTADLRVEVGVLDTGLDDVQGRGDSDRGNSTGDRGDKVCRFEVKAQTARWGEMWSAWSCERYIYARTLTPCRARVVGQVEEVLLGNSRTTEELLISLAWGENESATYSKGSRGVTSHGPSPSSVQRSHTFFRDQLEETTSSDSIGVGLHLDLENIKGQQDLIVSDIHR